MPAYCGNPKCFNYASFTCGRCQSDQYCSRNCQAVTFPSHRLQCFELPPLLKIETTEDMVKFSEETRNFTTLKQDQVLKVEEDTLKLLKEVEIQAKPESPPIVSKNVVEDLKIPKDEVKANSLPKQGFPPNDKHEVEAPVAILSTKPVNEPLNEPIKAPATLDLTFRRRGIQGMPKFKPQVIVTEPSRILIRDLKVRPLPAGKFKARLLEGVLESKLFAVCEHTEDVTNYLAKIEQSIAEFVAKDDRKSYTPVKDEVLLAKFDGVFYRAFCIDRDDDGYSVFFIDYGNSSSVSEAELKPLDKSLMFDVIVHPCYFENLPDELTEEIAEMLNKERVLLNEAKLVPGSLSYTARLILD